MSPGNSRPRGAAWPGPNGSEIAPAVGGRLFPQSRALGLDRTGHSPRVQQEIVHAGVRSPSYRQAPRDLAALSELTVTPKQVERLTRRIGQERVERRNAAVTVVQQQPLRERGTGAGRGPPGPPVARVSVDGGRLQVRSVAADPAAERSSHRRESKVAVLETSATAVAPTDPDPDVSHCFLDLTRT